MFPAGIEICVEAAGRRGDGHPFHIWSLHMVKRQTNSWSMCAWGRDCPQDAGRPGTGWEAHSSDALWVVKTGQEQCWSHEGSAPAASSETVWLSAVSAGHVAFSTCSTDSKGRQASARHATAGTIDKYIGSTARPTSIGIATAPGLSWRATCAHGFPTERSSAST